MLVSVAAWSAIGVTLGAALSGAVVSKLWHRRAVHLTSLVDADPLTGLANRRALQRLAPQSGRSWWVAYLDIDRFKCVNDHHGHLAGDRLLQVVANLLRVSVRPGDLVARVGGDEFVVVLVDCTRAEAIAVMRRVQHGLSSSVHGCTLSVGLCGVPARGVSAEYPSVASAMGAADAALGWAKRRGRGQLVVGAGLSPEVGWGAGRDRRS